MTDTLLLWIGFAVIVAVMMMVDLGVVNKNPHKTRMKEAAIWTCVWVAIALCFNALVFLKMGSVSGLQFLTGYILEYSLSVDNLFVFIMLFTAFRVPEIYQHRVLFWGILVAMIARLLFILGGVALVSRFTWILYIFGAFLIFAGIKMLFRHEEEEQPKQNFLVRFLSKILRIDNTISSEKFFVSKNRKLYATPLFLVLVAIETSDIIFAVDSVPAVLSVTTNPLIAVTSNIFAVMGLRSLYFLLAKAVKLFTYLSYGLAVILSFIGVKLCISRFVEIPIWMTLGFVISVLFVSIVASLLFRKKTKE